MFDITQDLLNLFKHFSYKSKSSSIRYPKRFKPSTNFATPFTSDLRNAKDYRV